MIVVLCERLCSIPVCSSGWPVTWKVLGFTPLDLVGRVPVCGTSLAPLELGKLKPVSVLKTRGNHVVALRATSFEMCVTLTNSDLQRMIILYGNCWQF